MRTTPAAVAVGRDALGDDDLLILRRPLWASRELATAVGTPRADVDAEAAAEVTTVVPVPTGFTLRELVPHRDAFRMSRGLGRGELGPCGVGRGGFVELDALAGSGGPGVDLFVFRVVVQHRGRRRDGKRLVVGSGRRG